MQHITLHLDGDGAFDDYDRPDGPGIRHIPNAHIRIGYLSGGMLSGKPSLVISILLEEDNTVVMAETSVAAFMVAAAGISGRRMRDEPARNDDMLPVAEIARYLDGAIENWRTGRDDLSNSPKKRVKASHYIDAFQSMRISLLGELLP